MPIRVAFKTIPLFYIFILFTLKSKKKIIIIRLIS